VSFGLASRILELPGSGPVAMGDFNGDGLPDLAVGGPSSLSIYLADGAGGFQLASTSPVPGFVESIAVGDFNGDGRLDVALAWPNPFFLPDAGEVLVFLGNGAGGLSAPIHLAAGFHPSSLVAADFNGDGHLDLAYANYDTALVSVRLGDGAGSFGPPITMTMDPTGSRPYRLSVGDIDGDGLPDLAVVLWDGEVAFFLATGGGHFRFGSRFSLDRTPASGLALADFNGDGRLDALVSIYGGAGSTGPVILFGHGNGDFDPPIPTGGAAADNNMGVADLNGDGKLDVVTSAGVVYLGDGLGGFLKVGSVPGSGPVAIGDFDGDGKPDVVVGAVFTSGAGIGQFAASPTYPTGGYPSNIFAADLNGDGKRDLVVVFSNTGVTALLGDGAGGFGAPIATPLPPGFTVAAVGDFNEDSHPDLLAVGFDTEGVVIVLPGDGTGHFGPALRTPLANGGLPVVADFNKDGHLDLAIRIGSNVAILPGDGTGHFGPATASLPSPPGILVATDLNGDGKPDLVVLAGNFTEVVTFLGDGHGGLTQAADITGLPSAVVMPLVTDVTGDGKPDLIVPGFHSITILPGDGAGGFGAPLPVVAVALTSKIIAADFNGDGKVDLTIGGEMLIGDGQGGFSSGGLFSFPGAVDLAEDFDGDGKPDLLGHDYGTGNIWVLHNTNCKPRRIDLALPFTFCATAGAALPIQPTARTHDDGGNLVTCGTGTVTASILPATGAPGAVLGGTATAPISGGIASFSNLSISLPGRGYRLQFDSPPLRSSVSPPFSQSLPAPAINGPTAVCTVGTFRYDGGIGFDSYLWKLDGTVVGSLQFVTVAGLSAGSHSLQLSVTQNGCTATGTLSLSTQTSPAAPAAFNTGPFVFGGTVQLFATTVAGATYEWSGPNGFHSTLQNPTIPNATPRIGGRYQVVSRVAGCASLAATTDVIVFPAPLCSGCTAPSFGPASKALDLSANLLAFTLADVNRDGVLDIVGLHGSFSNTVSIRLGDGRGGFGPPVISPFGNSGAKTLAMADLNGDGVPDVVATFYGGVLVASATPSGHLGPVSTYFTGTDVSDLAIADVNGDGVPDVVVANRGSNTVTVLLGRVGGGFGPIISLAVDPSPSAVALGKFAGSGRLDLAVASAGTQSVEVLLGDGTGIFGLPSRFSVPGIPSSLLAADVTGDGVTDLVVGVSVYPDQFLEVYQGAPGPAFTLTRSLALLPGGSAFPTFGPLLLADLDGDGKLDLLALRASGLMIFAGIGGPLAFAAPKVVPIAYSVPSLAVGDVTGDGIIDAVIGIGVGQWRVVILSGDGLGGFVEAPGFPVSSPGNPVFGKVIAKDLNGDGHPDILLSTGSSLSVFVSDGTSQFLSPVDYTPTTPPGGAVDAFVVGDVNGDGLPDLVEINHAFGVINVFPGMGNGSFGTPVTTSVGRSFSFRAAGDFNGDGRLDLLITDDYFSGSQGLNVLLGNSSMGFGAPIPIQGFLQSSFVAVADFNGDGKADIVAANAPASSVSVYLGDGTGHFGAPITTSLDSQPFSVIVGDFDGDSKQDIVVSAGGGMRFLPGNGSGGFGPARALPGSPLYADTLLSADFNGDGKLDIAATLQNAGTIAVWMGDGSGGFTGPSEYLAGAVGGPLAASDFDGDNRADLVFTDRGSPPSVRFLFSTSCVPTRLGVSVEPSTCNGAGAPLGVQPVVGVYDDGDNLVSCDAHSITASIVAGTGTPGATLGGSTSKAEAAGVATFTDLSITPAGVNYRFRFDHPIARRAVSRPVTVGPPLTVSIAGPASFCAGATVIFDAGPGYDGYTWLLDGAPVATARYADLVAIVPGPHTLQVQVTREGCSASSSVPINAIAPVLTGIMPVTGPSFGGTHVTVSGSCFVSGATLLFGGAPAAGVSLPDASTILATTPVHVPGAVDVVVTNPGGQIATLIGGFTYTGPTRVFVSVSGNDANDCGNVATPCRTVAAGLTQVADGGEVIVVSSGSYAGFTVSRAATVRAAKGVVAFSALPIDVSAGPADSVTLSGFTVRSSASAGIAFNTGAALTIENCFIRGGYYGIQASSSGELSVRDTTVRDSFGAGIFISNFSLSATIDRVAVLDNSYGIQVDSGARVSVRQTVASGNNYGFYVSGGFLELEGCTATQNSYGVLVSAGSMARVADCTVVDNYAAGLYAFGGTLLSRGDNTVEGNGTNVVGTVGTYTPK
jgi:hypothetical protein